jgi:hypothetical protein
MQFGLFGWEHAADMLPSVVGQMAAARGAEERTAWRQPVDLIALYQRAGLELPYLFSTSDKCHDWSGTGDRMGSSGKRCPRDPVPESTGPLCGTGDDRHDFGGTPPMVTSGWRHRGDFQRSIPNVNGTTVMVVLRSSTAMITSTRPGLRACRKVPQLRPAYLFSRWQWDQARLLASSLAASSAPARTRRRDHLFW